LRTMPPRGVELGKGQVTACAAAVHTAAIVESWPGQAAVRYDSYADPAVWWGVNMAKKNSSKPPLPPASLSMPARESLSAQSAEALKRYLVTEGLEPGDKLPPERRLAEALNVSRTVLREAVNQLVGEGLVRREPSRSPVVTNFDRQRLAYLLPEPEMIAFGSVGEVAGQLDVEPDQVQRFAQDLGYEGYQNLQESVRARYLRNAGLQPPGAPPPHGKLEESVAAQREQQRADLESLFGSVDAAQIDRICARLEVAPRVLLYGEGAAEALTGIFVRLLQHVGVHAHALPGGAVDAALGMYDLGEEDVVVAVALWLPFRSTVDIMRLAKAAGAQTIAFTASIGSPVTTYSDEVAIVPAQGRRLSFSTVATVALFENITDVLAARRPQLAAEIQQTLHDRYVQEGYVVPMRDLLEGSGRKVKRSPRSRSR
jgi:DNA-binding MurR/RpiR family transcriptional regulator